MCYVCACASHCIYSWSYRAFPHRLRNQWILRFKLALVHLVLHHQHLLLLASFDDLFSLTCSLLEMMPLILDPWESLHPDVDTHGPRLLLPEDDTRKVGYCSRHLVGLRSLEPHREMMLITTAKALYLDHFEALYFLWTSSYNQLSEQSY